MAAPVRLAPTPVEDPFLCFDAAPEERARSDERVRVERALAGDRATLRELLQDVAPSVARAVRSIVGPGSANADDLTQEALLALVRALPTFRGESSLVRYAYRIAVRTALPECRKNRSRDALFQNFATGEKVRAEREATDLCVRRSRKELVRSLLAALPEPQAYAFAHRVIWGASLEEIAEDSGVPVNTVRTRLRLAKEAIRRRLEAEPELIELLENRR